VTERVLDRIGDVIHEESKDLPRLSIRSCWKSLLKTLRPPSQP
jgi:hypothetical protein